MSWLKRIKRLNTSKLLVMASVAFLFPIFYLLFYSIVGYNGYISFAEKEKMGAELLSKLKPIMIELSKYQSTKGLTKISINSQFDELVNLSLKYENDIGLSKEKLALQKKSDIHPNALFDEWKSISSGNFSEEKVISLLNNISALYLHIGDVSNLILDPDLDSYYLMDVALLAIPQSIKRIFDLKSYVNRLSEQQVSFDNKIYLAVFQSSFKQADLDRINASTITALDQDANFYGVSPSLKPAIQQSLNDFNESSQELLSANEASQSFDGIVNLKRIMDASDNTLLSGSKLWDKSIEELIVLLDIRINDYKYGRLITTVIALLLVLFAYMLLLFVSKTTTKKLNRIIEFLNCVQGGDFNKAQSTIKKLESELY